MNSKPQINTEAARNAAIDSAIKTITGQSQRNDPVQTATNLENCAKMLEILEKAKDVQLTLF